MCEVLYMDYLEPCHYSTRLIEKLQSLDTENILDFELIDKAIYWAKKYHDGQFRKSGEPFYSHPLEVACRGFDLSNLRLTRFLIFSLDKLGYLNLSVYVISVSSECY